MNDQTTTISTVSIIVKKQNLKLGSKISFVENRWHIYICLSIDSSSSFFVHHFSFLSFFLSLFPYFPICWSACTPLSRAHMISHMLNNCSTRMVDDSVCGWALLVARVCKTVYIEREREREDPARANNSKDRNLFDDRNFDKRRKTQRNGEMERGQNRSIELFVSRFLLDERKI